MSTLTPELLADLPLAEAPALTPDGRWIAVSVGATSRAEEHRRSAIWLVATDGSSKPRQISSGPNDYGPRWSPDGRSLAFLSDRQKRGTHQLHVLRLDGGDALPVTDERGGVSTFRWLPGERERIAYTTPATRDENDPEEKRRKEQRDDARVYGEFWPSASLRLLDIETGEARTGDAGDKHVADMAVSPDGGRIAVVLWDTPEIDHVVRPVTLAIVDAIAGRVERAIRAPMNPHSLVWSVEGDRVFYVSTSGPTAVSSYQAWVADAGGEEEPRCLTGSAAFCVDSLTRLGSDIVALAAVGTESALQRIDPDSGEATLLQHFEGALSWLTASDDGSTVAAIGSVAEHGEEVYAGPPSGPLRRLTNFQGALDDIVFGPQKVVTWERDGLTLDGILIFPPGKTRDDGPLPTVVSIHGGPYGRWANAFVHRFGRWIAQHGYLVFLPNPRGGSGHGAAFAESVLHTVGNEDYLDIMAGVDMLVEQGLADPERLGCGGWSQGGFMTAWVVGHTERFKSAIMGAGVSDWGMMIATSDIPSYETLMGGGNPYEGAGPHSFDAQSPISFVSRVKTPVLILHGEMDPRVPLSQGTYFHRGLLRYGVPTELVTYPREPHSIGERAHQIDMLKRIAAWHQRWIPVD